MREKHRAALEDRDGDPEINQRHRDFHAEEAAAEHDSASGARSGLSKRFGIGPTVQRMDAGKFGAGPERAFRYCACGDQELAVRDALAGCRPDRMHRRIDRGDARAEPQLDRVFAIEGPRG